uniref:Uncharacterized protein n=1 Tax=Peronospora matthiolae TaxID=2874970 RepID=A0AAV1UMP8_9STRA
MNWGRESLRRDEEDSNPPPKAPGGSVLPRRYCICLAATQRLVCHGEGSIPAKPDSLATEGVGIRVRERRRYGVPWNPCPVSKDGLYWSPVP